MNTPQNLPKDHTNEQIFAAENEAEEGHNLQKQTAQSVRLTHNVTREREFNSRMKTSGCVLCRSTLSDFGKHFPGDFGSRPAISAKDLVLQAALLAGCFLLAVCFFSHSEKQKIGGSKNKWRLII